MRKLDQPMVNWICREMAEGRLSRWEVANRAGVTKQWAYKLYARYLKSGRPPERRACGCKPQRLSAEVKDRIKAEYTRLPIGAVRMETRLRKKGVRVSHNKIHEVLRDAGLARREPKKSVKRKYVRYERHKANSLWHADWKMLDGKHLILFEDDATRLVVGYGLFDVQSAELALQVFFIAVQKYGLPRQLLTDNGAEFCNTQDHKDLKHAFHGGAVKAGCDHIFTRPSHPQCNGKLERLNYTIEQLYHHYRSDLDKAIRMYNEERIHMSLGGGWLTPLEAWQKKIAKGLKYEAPIKT